MADYDLAIIGGGLAQRLVAAHGWRRSWRHPLEPPPIRR
jgi:hypothetical protein